jgi:2-iminobutanoate/2-iminopropanoate deaminase
MNDAAIDRCHEAPGDVGEKAKGKVMGKEVNSIGAEARGQANVALPFSPAVRAGDFVFVSGQVGFGEDKRIVPGGIEAEARQTLQNIANILALDGSSLEDVVKCTVWLHDARDFGAFNKVFAECFPGRKPARSTVESRLMIDAKIEIDAIAYRPVAP